MHTNIIATHGLASFVPLFLQTPCPPHSIFYLPTESHEVSESFAITVCIYRQQSQDPECVHVWEWMWVDGCFEVTLPKTRTLSPMTHLHYWTRRPGELTSPVLRPRVTASSDLTTIQVWEESARDCLSCRSLKVTASFPHFLSTGRSKYVALHLKTKLFREAGTAQLLSFLSYPQTHAVIHSLCVSIYTCINSLSCSSLEARQRSCSHQCSRTHIQTHACTNTGLRPSCCWCLNISIEKTCSCLARLLE